MSNLVDQLLEAAPISVPTVKRPDFLPANVRRRINVALGKHQVLSGNDRSRTKGHALSLIAETLREFGYVLDLVTGDILLGDKGHRSLPFRLDGGAEIEYPRVENSRVSFAWEQLDPDRMEIIAYVS